MTLLRRLGAFAVVALALVAVGLLSATRGTPVSGVRAGVLYMAPTTGSTVAERFLALSIAGARRTLYVTTPLFVPDDDFRGLLVAAARRGVDVRVLTAGAGGAAYHAARARYAEPLAGGVRVYEYRRAALVAAPLVADGRWATVGSMNVDNRSLAFDNEANLVVEDAAFAPTMAAVFLEDLRSAREITAGALGDRWWSDRVLAGGASLFSRVL